VLIEKSFKKCCITNALDGSEDDVLWDDDDECKDTDSSTDEHETDSDDCSDKDE